MRTIHEMLCAIRRNRILLGVAAVVLPLIVIFALLEISYRAELAREISQNFTGSLPSPPPASPTMQIEHGHSQWTSLARPNGPIVPPSLAVEAPSPSTEPTQGAIISRKPVPLPRSRPNRL
jgi:hypothetical protein